MQPAELVIRLAEARDRAALEDALLWAVNWSGAREPIDRDTVLSASATAHYVQGWPRPGDLGVVAEHRGTVGAAWLRYLPLDDPGYGFVAPQVPELSIGVHPQHRGRGTGRAMLRALLRAAERNSVTQVSLSVERDNPARRLYLSEGFRVVGGRDGSDTMLVHLPTSAESRVRRR